MRVTLLTSQTPSTFHQKHNMKRLSLADSTKVLRSSSSSRFACPFAQRLIHTSPLNTASVAPTTASGPPPAPPTASAEHVDSRVARRRKQAELLKRGQDLRAVAAGTGGGTAKTKRFWKDVHVKTADGMARPRVHILILEIVANMFWHFLQKDSRSTLINVLSVALPKTSLPFHTTNLISHPR